MPLYTYACDCGSRFERFLPLERYAEPQICECGARAVKQMPRVTVMVSPDIHYESPIDGRPITSMAARRDDLARSNCVAYDPDIKQHVAEKAKREEAELEKAIDYTVDREIALMPARKREKLEAELQGGMTVDPIRVTPAAKPIHKELTHNV